MRPEHIVSCAGSSPRARSGRSHPPGHTVRACHVVYMLRSALGIQSRLHESTTSRSRERIREKGLTSMRCQGPSEGAPPTQARARSGRRAKPRERQTRPTSRASRGAFTATSHPTHDLEKAPRVRRGRGRGRTQPTQTEGHGVQWKGVTALIQVRTTPGGPPASSQGRTTGPVST